MVEEAGATANGRGLWSILYWFWFVAGVVVGNDPIILSGRSHSNVLTPREC